jgi:hypothetical protein
MAKYDLDTRKFSVAIAVVERSAGNDQVGDMWIETKSFPVTASIKDVIDWAATRCSGRLILTLDQSSDASTTPNVPAPTGN